MASLTKVSKPIICITILIFSVLIQCLFIMHSHPFPLHFLDDHSQLFALNPLLLYFFVQEATLGQYEKLITKVDLFLLLTAFVEKIPQYSEHKVHMSNQLIKSIQSMFCIFYTLGLGLGKFVHLLIVLIRPER